MPHGSRRDIGNGGNLRCREETDVSTFKQDFLSRTFQAGLFKRDLEGSNFKQYLF
jgi:hypothetical protein